MVTRENLKPKVKIIDSFWAFLFSTAVFGPFALPLLWRNPRYKKTTKILGSVVVVLLTVLLIWIVKVYIDPFLAQYKALLEQSQ